MEPAATLNRICREVGVCKKGLDPCEEARYTSRLYREDVAAGHTGGAQHWKGQSEAYGFMCSLQNKNNPRKEGDMAEGKCNPEDIICRADLLAKMRNLRGAFNDPTFSERHPSLVELAPKLDAAIKAEEISLGEDLGTCDLPVAPPPQAEPGGGGESEP